MVPFLSKVVCRSVGDWRNSTARWTKHAIGSISANQCLATSHACRLNHAPFFQSRIWIFSTNQRQKRSRRYLDRSWCYLYRLRLWSILLDRRFCRWSWRRRFRYCGFERQVWWHGGSPEARTGYILFLIRERRRLWYVQRPLPCGCYFCLEPIVWASGWTLDRTRWRREAQLDQIKPRHGVKSPIAVVVVTRALHGEMMEKVVWKRAVKVLGGCFIKSKHFFWRASFSRPLLSHSSSSSSAGSSKT